MNQSFDHGLPPASRQAHAPGSLPEKILVRVERTEWAEIEVDVAGLIAEWADEQSEPWQREDIIEVLYKIGVRDLLYSGDFIKVLDKDAEESIR